MSLAAVVSGQFLGSSALVGSTRIDPSGTQWWNDALAVVFWMTYCPAVCSMSTSVGNLMLTQECWRGDIGTQWRHKIDVGWPYDYPPTEKERITFGLRLLATK